MKSINIKTKDVDVKVAHLIKKRWSTRAFSNQQISNEQIATLFEATRWTASSMNEQPWSYIYAKKGSEAYDKMVDCMMDGNKPWAKNASIVVLSLAKKNFDYNDFDNRHYLYDIGAANTTLLLQAADMDIYGHLIGGFEMEKAVKAFEVPATLEIACFISLGFLDDAETLEEPFKSRELSPRPRKEISEFAFEGKLG
jgi:nitroreductase|tara:strand:- start:392 stop:982 length:591 start_codon:yes stop_codon:yes gene_type:complete